MSLAHTFTVNVADSTGASAQQPFTLNLSPLSGSIVVQSGVASTHQVTFSQGTLPIACSVVGALPSWITYNNNTKQFSFSSAAPQGAAVTVTLSCDNCANSPSSKTYNIAVV
jgi:hypothetical protein